MGIIITNKHNLIIYKQRNFLHLKYAFFTITLFIFFIHSITLAQKVDIYYKIKILNVNSQTLNNLSSIGIPLEETFFDKKYNSLEAYVNNRELLEIKMKGIEFSILINDVEKWNEERLKSGEKEFLKLKSDSIPKGFFYGTMGGYPKLNEYIRMLDTMNVLYPSLTTQKISIGRTYEGRDIYLIIITNHKNQNPYKKKVLYTGLHHAREGASITTVLYYMFHILENYGKDSLITYLVDNVEMFFVPMVNPDGYAYNQLTNPNGGGMWRKNRSIINGLPQGVDLNRNYGYKWGYDDNGSSSWAGAETFRGLSAFSELETKAIRELCKQNKFITAVNYHTYGNLIIYPWGYINNETPDSTYYRYYARDAAKSNNYTVGTGVETVGYITNGDSDDWMYGEQVEKDKILAYTIEMGESSDGFWATKNRIIPIAKENINPNLLIAKISGAFIDNFIVSADTSIRIGDTVNIKIGFKNIGLSNAENIQMNLILEDSSLELVSGTINIPNVSSFKSFDTAVRVRFNWNPNTPVGYYANYNIKLSYNGFPVTKNLKLTKANDSPIVYLSYNIKQEGNKVLLFWTTRSEKNNSQFYIERMFSSGAMFSIFQQIGTVDGSGNSDSTRSYVYIDTISFLLLQNRSVSCTYRLRTSDKNGSNQYSDSIQIILNPILSINPPPTASYYLKQNYPNPFNPETTIEYGIPVGGIVSIKLYDILGREIKTLIDEYKTKGKYKINVSSNNLPSQVYFYRITVNNYNEIKRMVVVR